MSVRDAASGAYPHLLSPGIWDCLISHWRVTWASEGWAGGTWLRHDRVLRGPRQLSRFNSIVNGGLDHSFNAVTPGSILGDGQYEFVNPSPKRIDDVLGEAFSSNLGDD
ncbi:MAG: hypothetical protein ACE5O2_02780, partial [Armatimonadota bacterium]